MPVDPDPYLLGLVLDGRAVVVMGAGAVAERRIDRLVAAGAQVTLIAPEATSGLRGRAEAGELSWRARGVEPGDLDGVWFVLAASDDPEANAAVAAEAERRRIFCVRADDASGGSARTPATVVEGGVLLGLLTRHTVGHGNPGRIRAIRDGLAERLRELVADP